MRSEITYLHKNSLGSVCSVRHSPCSSIACKLPMVCLIYWFLSLFVCRYDKVRKLDILKSDPRVQIGRSTWASFMVHRLRMSTSHKNPKVYVLATPRMLQDNAPTLAVREDEIIATEPRGVDFEGVRIFGRTHLFRADHRSFFGYRNS